MNECPLLGVLSGGNRQTSRWGRKISLSHDTVHLCPLPSGIDERNCSSPRRHPVQGASSSRNTCCATGSGEQNEATGGSHGGLRRRSTTLWRELCTPFSLSISPYLPIFADHSSVQVLELQEKSLKMPDDMKWHFIGHLQTNKVKKLLETKGLYVVETVDSLKLAKELNKHLESNKTSQFNTSLQYPLNVFVQVKTSDEDSKSGVEPSDCVSLVKTIMSDMPNLKVCGLMTIGKLQGDPVQDFTLLRQTRTSVSDALGIPVDQLELSMGMSSDFEVAVRI